MDEMQQAHNELDRLQEIIARHEGHMITMRGWLFTIVGGLLAAYYTDNINISEVVIWIALPVVTLLFLLVELRHVNLVEAAVERVGALEHLIAASRNATTQFGVGWYDGPKVNATCQRGAERLRPHRGMTLLLNSPFYVVVFLIILLLVISLPPKTAAAPAQGKRAGDVQRFEASLQGVDKNGSFTCRSSRSRFRYSKS